MENGKYFFFERGGNASHDVFLVLCFASVSSITCIFSKVPALRMFGFTSFTSAELLLLPLPPTLIFYCTWWVSSLLAHIFSFRLCERFFFFFLHGDFTKPAFSLITHWVFFFFFPSFFYVEKKKGIGIPQWPPCLALILFTLNVFFRKVLYGRTRCLLLVALLLVGSHQGLVSLCTLCST